MSNLKKTVLIIMMILTIVALARTAFAADDYFEQIPDDSLNDGLNNTANDTINSLFNNVVNNEINSTVNNGVNNIVNNITDNSAVNNMLSNTNRNTSSVYNNTDLPKAGSADGITIIAMMIVLGISAVYAYKKVRDYNIK